MPDSPARIELTLDEALERALALHRAGNFAGAGALYRAMLQVAPAHFDALHLLGVIHHQQGRHAEAITAIEAALALRPHSAEAHSNLGLALLAEARATEALDHFEQALALRPGYAEALNNRGNALHALQRDAEALASLEQALAVRPSYPEAQNNRGVILRTLGRHDEAMASFDAALAIQPAYLEAIGNRANALLAAGRHAESLADYERVLAIRPDAESALRGRGSALLRLGRAAEALASHERALALRPANPDACNDRGIALDTLGRHREAVASYDAAIALRPDYAEARNNRGNALQALGRHDDALASYDTALATRPGFVDAHVNRGIALHALLRQDEAIASYDAALALQPDHADALVNRAAALYRLGRWDEAQADYERALRAHPNHPEAHWHAGLLRLARGDFAAGWPELEWRWKAPSFTSPRRAFAQPPWLGAESLAGATLLLHAEQGLGDTLQFVRYAPLAAARGATVILEVQPELRALLAELDGVHQIVERGGALPPFDRHTPLLSLPLAFGTTAATIPAHTPYLRAPKSRRARFRKRVGDRSSLRVGIAWAGNADHRNDRNRSIELAALLPLLALPGCRFVSLQRELRSGDAALLAERPEILRAGEDTRDFADTAALVELVDAVVTVDTAVAHLAGALARPVWILLPRSPDWRWMFERTDSPWYPTARLVRQTRIGDWGDVIERVGAALVALRDGEGAATKR